MASKPRITGRGAKDKGAKYERELAAYFNTVLFEGKQVVTRMPLSGGGSFAAHSGGGQADLLGLPHLWPEAKRTERLKPLEAMRQAEEGIAKSGSPDLPVVITRQSNVPTEDSLVFMRLKDFVRIYGSALTAVPIDAVPAQVEDDELTASFVLSPLNGDQ